MIGFEIEPPEWFYSAPEFLRGQIEALPLWAKEQLFTLGDDGFNTSLMGVSNALSKFLEEDGVEEILTLAGEAYHRELKPGEIDRVVAKAFDTSPPSSRTIRSKYLPERVAEIFQSSEVQTLAELRNEYPRKATETKTILREMFHEDELLCLAENPKKAKTKPLSDWLEEDLDGMPFIVPSPMTAPRGATQDGKKSPRCLGNTGMRRNLVIEFDNGTHDEQAALIWRLAKVAPLVLVVDSGRKSLHAWFKCEGVEEAKLQRFMDYAVTLGGDRATWTRCQLVRTPGATRDNGNEQRVIVFRPLDAMLEKWQLEGLPDLESDFLIDDDERTFPLIHCSEIETSTESRDFVEGLLTTRAVSLVFGRPGCGKSFWTLSLAASVAMGSRWRDREVDRGGVIYVCLEGQEGFRNRLQALKKGDYLSNTAPFWLSESSVNFLSDNDGAKLVATVEDAAALLGGPIALVVVDTLSRSMPGGNENGVEDMTKMLATVEAIKNATGAHVCLVHHNGKDESRGARGHSSLLGAIDTEIEIGLDAQSGISTPKVTKQKDLECSGTFPFKLLPVGLGEDDKGRPITSCLIEHLDSSQAPPRRGRASKYKPRQLLELLPVANATAWKDSAFESLGIPKSSFYSLKKGLIEGDDYEPRGGEIVAISSGEETTDLMP